MKITNRDLENAYKKAADIHKNHLVGEDVKLPEWGKQKAYQLAILIHVSPDYIHKDKISDVVRKKLPSAARDQQVRHLKRDGWNLESDNKGQHRIVEPYRAHPDYVRQKVKSQNQLLAGDFDAIKKAFSFKCATCGAKEGEPDPRYAGDGAVKLQKGHRDPDKPLKKDNVIPQCQFCNRAYKDDFTFDKKGRVRSVASPKPVLRASKAVRKKIAAALKEKDRK